MFLNDPMTSRKCSARDFIFKEELGHGSYSTVYKAYDKRNIKRIFAVKVCSKAHIIKEGKVKYVTIEKNTLNLLAKGNHPGIIKLYYTFHDEQNLYFVLDFASGGELLSLLHKYGTFSESWSKHFTVQLIDTLDYIHSQGVIHRDLKPENVLLNKTGSLTITDFGAALFTHCDGNNNNHNNNDDKQITSASSFVGTAEYVSPELLLHNQCGFGSDIWALGCMIFQFFEGHPPFRGENELKTFEKIVSLEYLWNGSQSIIDSRIKSGIPSIVISLVRKILVIDTKKRLSLNNIKSNPWFTDINWENKKNIWKGIWEIGQNEVSTRHSKGVSSNDNNNNVGTNFTANSYHRMIPNRQLHVIDTPIKSIEITKQKKKKPTKISNTTSSIVEWRKKLGISTTHINNKLQIVDMTTDIDNIGSDLIIPTRLSTKPKVNTTTTTNNNNKTVNISSSNNNTTEKQDSISRQHDVKNTNNLHNIMNITTTVEPNIKNEEVTTLNTDFQNQINNEKCSLNDRNHNLSQDPIIKMDKTTILSQLPNQNDVLTSSTAKLTKLNIFKQGYVNLYEIPYKQNGPGMSLTSYNQIDNDLITTFVTSHQNNLKSSNDILNLLILKKNGSLYFCNIQPTNTDENKDSDEHFIVNIGDSDLSVYDFEFDEIAKSGFLILEKYRKGIWFISLPKSDELKNDQNINEQRTWVDCFFTVRQLIEDQSNNDIENHVDNVTNKLDNVTVIDKAGSSKIKCTDAPITPTTSTKVSVQLPSHSPKFNTKKTASKITSQSKSPSTSRSSNYYDKKKSNNIHINTTCNNIPSPTTHIPRQRQTSANFSNSNNPNNNKSITDTQSYGTDNNIPTYSSVPHPISLPTTLRVNTNNIHKTPSSPVLPSSSPLFSRMTVNEHKKILSPHFKAKSFISNSSSDTHTSNHSNHSNTHYTILNSPTSNTKKYNAPKNMVITSSRYEVIHTLSNQNILDQSVASSGASAAFKSLQRKKPGHSAQ